MEIFLVSVHLWKHCTCYCFRLCKNQAKSQAFHFPVCVSTGGTGWFESLIKGILMKFSHRTAARSHQLRALHNWVWIVDNINPSSWHVYWCYRYWTKLTFNIQVNKYQTIDWRITLFWKWIYLLAKGVWAAQSKHTHAVNAKPTERSALSSCFCCCFDITSESNAKLLHILESSILIDINRD